MAITPQSDGIPIVPQQRQSATLSRSQVVFLIKEFWQSCRGYRILILMALLAESLATLCTLLIPSMTKIIVDSGMSDRPLAFPWTLVLPADSRGFALLFFLTIVMFALTLTGALLRVQGYWLITRAAEHIRLRFRRRVFANAIRLPLHRLQSFTVGGMSGLIRHEAGCVSELLVDVIYYPWRAVIQLLCGIAILVAVDWRFLAGLLLVLPIVVLTHGFWFARIYPLEQAVRDQRQKMDGHAAETFAGIRVIKEFRKEAHEEINFCRNDSRLTRLRLRVWWMTRVLEILWELALPLATGAVLLYGSWCIDRGTLSLGDLLMFLVYLALLIGPVAVLVNTLGSIQPHLVAFANMTRLLYEPTEGQSRLAFGLAMKEPFQSLVFHQVSLKYPESKATAIQDMSITITQGETLAIVGSSGAGKTSIVNLLIRFYDPSSGSITLNGRDIRDFELSDYRQLFSVVDQDIVLFDGTVAENIAYGAPAADEGMICRAAEIANASFFISQLPQGYNTRMGERGVRLSGGQRQRIALARAILANCPILILDEAMSHLDDNAEAAIRQGLLAARRGRTCILIAHRLNTWIVADRIVVLESGKVCDVGTHSELSVRCDEYLALMKRQKVEHSFVEMPGIPQVTVPE